MLSGFFRKRKIKSLKIRISGLEAGIIANGRCRLTDPYAHELLGEFRKELELLESKDKLITAVKEIINDLPKDCNDSCLGQFITSLEKELRGVVYVDGAVFVPVCACCHRFVCADKTILVSEGEGLKDQPNATCSKCGRTKMLFEGFY